MENPPRSFYDKLFWMSVHTDTSLWSALADKVQVRAYISKRCGSEILTDLYATYDKAESVDFDALPTSFAIKTNNGCGANYLVKSKTEVDLEDIRRSLRYWLAFPYGELTGQMHYARIVPQILVEELLFQAHNPNATLVDYKFYCFNGVPRYCYVVSERQFDQKHSHSRMMYDMEWHPMPDVFVKGKPLSFVERPAALERMKSVSSRLSEGIPFVRVDLYEVNGEVKFSEMTFLPGMDPGYTETFQSKLGGLIELPPSTLPTHAGRG